MFIKYLCYGKVIFKSNIVLVFPLSATSLRAPWESSCLGMISIAVAYLICGRLENLDFSIPSISKLKVQFKIGYITCSKKNQHNLGSKQICFSLKLFWAAEECLHPHDRILKSQTCSNL